MRMFNHLYWPVNIFKRLTSKQGNCGPGEPLYLTNYIKTKDFAAGRKAARVQPFDDNIISYSGFLTVNEMYNSNMFFWFFPSEKEPLNDPLIIWLNGLLTPSTYGLFLMNGPYTYTEKGLGLRELSWHKWFNILYIDNPLGVGFSHTDSPEGYPKDTTEIANNLFRTLDQFLELFPEYSTSDLYLASLSFGGNYLPHFAQAISNSHRSSMLKGVFLGNPVIDVKSQVGLADHLYQMGFIEEETRQVFMSKEASFKEKVEKQDYSSALAEVFEYALPNYESLVKKTLGINVMNYMCPEPPELYRRFLNEDSTRKAIHVGATPIPNNELTLPLISNFSLQSTKTLYEELLQNYKLLIYNGDLDLLILSSLLGQLINSFEWEGAEKFRKAKREIIFKDNRVIGFKKQYSNLNYSLILGAGHEAIHDQPESLLNLLFCFTSDKRK